MAGEDEAGQGPAIEQGDSRQAIEQPPSESGVATASAGERAASGPAQPPEPMPSDSARPPGHTPSGSAQPTEHTPPDSAQPSDHTPPDSAPPADGEATDGGAADLLPAKPGFGERGRMRRRARFLRKARELAYRDLGGLVFDLHRFGQRNDPVVLAKLATLGQIDRELRAIEQTLGQFKPVTVLREVGIGACPRCAALHGSEDRFCPGCGIPFDADAERPLSTTPVTPTAPAAPAPSALASPMQTPAAPQTHSRPAAEPVTTLSRPGDAPAGGPPLKPTATPVAARPGAGEPSATSPSAGRPSATDRSAGEPSALGPKPADDKPSADGASDPDEEPTQILRPPSGAA
ncbi:MAG TPA: hypothetical protein VMS02_01365 [Solirubrobacteraceae bacterium]|nr:hypothetical protein [Solirubrobacteraceae bacterium]